MANHVIETMEELEEVLDRFNFSNLTLASFMSKAWGALTRIRDSGVKPGRIDDLLFRKGIKKKGNLTKHIKDGMKRNESDCYALERFLGWDVQRWHPSVKVDDVQALRESISYVERREIEEKSLQEKKKPAEVVEKVNKPVKQRNENHVQINKRKPIIDLNAEIKSGYTVGNSQETFQFQKAKSFREISEKADQSKNLALTAKNETENHNEE